MIEEQIKKCLKKQPMTIEEISRELQISRATASKYLLVLEIKRKVNVRAIGKAKLFSLNN